MRISDWSSDVCSSDLTGWPSGPATRRRCRPSWRITRPASMASPEKQTGKGEMALSQTAEVETNQDKRSYVRAEDARTFGTRLLLAAGLPDADAVIVAHCLVPAAPRRVATHGLQLLPPYPKR